MSSSELVSGVVQEEEATGKEHKGVRIEALVWPNAGKSTIHRPVNFSQQRAFYLVVRPVLGRPPP